MTTIYANSRIIPVVNNKANNAGLRQEAPHRIFNQSGIGPVSPSSTTIYFIGTSECLTINDEYLIHLSTLALNPMLFRNYDIARGEHYAQNALTYPIKLQAMSALKVYYELTALKGSLCDEDVKKVVKTLGYPDSDLDGVISLYAQYVYYHGLAETYQLIEEEQRLLGIALGSFDQLFGSGTNSLTNNVGLVEQDKVKKYYDATDHGLYFTDNITPATSDANGPKLVEFIGDVHETLLIKSAQYYQLLIFLEANKPIPKSFASSFLRDIDWKPYFSDAGNGNLMPIANLKPNVEQELVKYNDLLYYWNLSHISTAANNLIENAGIYASNVTFSARMNQVEIVADQYGQQSVHIKWKNEGLTFLSSTNTQVREIQNPRMTTLNNTADMVRLGGVDPRDIELIEWDGSKVIMNGNTSSPLILTEPGRAVIYKSFSLDSEGSPIAVYRSTFPALADQTFPTREECIRTTITEQNSWEMIEMHGLNSAITGMQYSSNVTYTTRTARLMKSTSLTANASFEGSTTTTGMINLALRSANIQLSITEELQKIMDLYK